MNKVRRIFTSCGVTLLVAALSLATSSSALAARPVVSSQRMALDARILIKALANREDNLGAPGSYQASRVINASGENWLVLEGADGPNETDPSVTASPYPNGTVQIYRWILGQWSLRGTVLGWFGPIGECCAILAEHLTGSEVPDFVLYAGGAADTTWTAVVSETGGKWHQVLFDYGYTDTPVVNSYAIKDHGVLTAVDACSCATGPTTELFETYRDGVFRPAPPPGRSPRCSLAAFREAVGYRDREPPFFSKFDCADGWALAVGSEAGSPAQVVGLFAARGSRWSLIKLDSGESLGSDPWNYDLPLSLLEQLASTLEPSLRPAVATGELIAQPATIGPAYTGDVMTADGTEWFVAETATGSEDAPGANALIYRWSGSEWAKVGEVDQVPVSLNFFQSAQPLTFVAVSVSGSTDPNFTVSTAPTAAVLTDLGGVWHVAT